MSDQNVAKHEDIPSSAYYSYIISLLKRDKFGCTLLEQRDSKQWPRFDSYSIFINNIVFVGSKAPIKSIRTFAALILTFDDNDDLKKIFEINGNEEKFNYSKLLLYFIFADSVAQLMSYIDPKKNAFDKGKPSLYQPLLKICERVLNFKNNNTKFLNYLNIVIRQYSVISYMIQPSYDLILSYIEAARSVEDYSSVSNLFLLYRYVKPNNENALDFIEQALPEKDKIGNVSMEVIKSGLYQLPSKIYTDKEIGDLKGIIDSNCELKALFMSRNKSTTFKDISEFMKSCNDGCLEGFLYLLRKPEFKPLSEIWEYGERNDNFYLFQEKNFLSSYENEDFVKIFFECVAKKVGDNELSTKIILNLLARDLNQNIKIFCQNIQTNKNKQIIGPFFNALTIIFDPKSGFLNANNSLNEDSKECLTNVIKLHFGQDKAEFTEIPSFCRTVTAQSCKDLTPNQDVMPQASKNDFTQRIEKAKRLTGNILDSNENENTEVFFDKEKAKFNLFTNITNKHAEWQKKIYIITILYNIDQKPTDDFFYYLVNMTLGKIKIDKSSYCANTAYFALYALQVFYIRKHETSFSILSAINKVMKERTIGKKIAFTLLNLLNQLFALPIFSVDLEVQEDYNWFSKWSNETQAILLAHLTSPFAHVRDITLLVMERLNEILKLYEINTSITSLMHEYDAIMIQRVEQRLKVSGYSIPSLDKLNFSTILRSPNYFLVIYALVEYAQALSREEMSNVLKEFFDLNVLKSIKRDLTLDQLPFISFVQRICPMYSKSKKIINQNFFDFPGMHSFKAYNILNNEFSLDEEAQDLIKSFTSLFSKDSITKECKKLKNSQKDYNTLASLANSLSIELMPNFIQGFVNYLNKNKADKVDVDKRIGKIICCILLSSDFSIFTFVHMEDVSILYQSFTNWYLKAFNSNADIKDDLEFMLCFCSSILSLSQSLVQYGKKADLPWSIQSRQQCFKFLLEQHEKQDRREMVEKTILTLLDSVSIFDSDCPIDMPVYQALINIEAQNPNARPLRSVLIHHPNLFNIFFERSINFSINHGLYYYRAITEFFICNFRNFNQSDLNDNVKIVIDNTGKLILSGLIFIASSHNDIRKSAFDLLKCVLPIIGAFYNKENIQNTGNINSYLIQHQNELNNYSITPSNQQVYELAECISENMTFTVSKVFEAFFNFFSPIDNFSDYILVSDSIDRQTSSTDSTGVTMISPNYFTHVLNAVAPFARYLTFSKGVSVYPSHASVRGIDFINNLIDIYPHLSKSSVPYYAKIFNEACNTNENTRTLARLLIMNSNSLIVTDKPNILKATTTILLYLIQNSNPTEFLSLLLQRLSFGYWFTNKYGSTDLLTKDPYKLLDWFELTLNILQSVAVADFSRLYPYLHEIIHFCLIFNNLEKDYNNKLSSLLQLVCNNIDIKISVPEDAVIQYYNDSDQLSVSSIVKQIAKPLKTILPKSIKDWKNCALQWAASCGDLILAGRSAVIYSCLDESPDETDNEIITNSLFVVFRETQLVDAVDQGNSKFIFYYLRGILNMMLSNVKFSIDHKMEDSIKRFLYYSMTVLSIADKDEESAKIALKIVNEILKNNQTRIDKYETFSKLMAISFNEPLLLSVLCKIFVSRVVENRNRIIILGHLLLYLYASISAHQSASPFNSFVNEILIGYLFKKIILLREQQTNYGEIFKEYFSVNEKKESAIFKDNVRPIEFIEAIVKEIWTNPNDSPFISDLIYSYATILNTTYKAQCKSGNIIRDLVFVVVKVFIDKCPDEGKEQIPTFFDNIVSYAINEDTEAARELLAIQIKASIEGEEHSEELPKPIIEPTKPVLVDFEKTFRNFITNILSSDKYYPTNCSPIIDFKTCTPSNILMFCTRYNKHDEKLVKPIYGKKFQPFDEQRIFWNEIQQEKIGTPEKTDANENVGNNEPFDFYSHSQSRNAIQCSNEQYASIEFDPKSFILRDEDFELYDRRLNKKATKKDK